MSAEQTAYNNRGLLKGKIASLANFGYNVQIPGGNLLKGVHASDYTWQIDDWVQMAITDSGYSIIGQAPSGQVENVAPEEGSGS